VKRNHRTIGLISTMSPDKTWAQEVLDRVARTHSVVKKTLEDMGFEVLDEGPLHRSYSEMTEAARSLRYRGINALVIYVGTWTYSNCAASAALETGVPVVIWGDAVPGTCGLVGATVAQGGMGEVGMHSRLVYGLFDDPDTRAKAKIYLDAACAAIGMRGQVMGLGGGRSLGMLPAVCDPNEVRTKFGLEIDQFEQMEVIERAKSIPDEQAVPMLDWVKSTFGEIVAKEDVLIKQTKLYFALQETIADRGYDFVAVKCLPETPPIYTTFCLAHAIMGDASDHTGPKDRMVFSCEADIAGGITMQLMQLLSGGPVSLTDLTEMNLETNVITTCNCGSQPTDFAPCKKDVRWEIEGVHEFEWKYGGCCPQFVAKAGRATAARLARVNGEYEMLIAPVEVVEMPREKLRDTIWERPHMFLKLLCNRDDFISKVQANHIHTVYGDWTEELVEMCSILGIRPVVVEEVGGDK